MIQPKRFPTCTSENLWPHNPTNIYETEHLVCAVVVEGVEWHANHLAPAVQLLPNPETAQHAHFDLQLARPQLDGAEGHYLFIEDFNLFLFKRFRHLCLLSAQTC